LNDLNSHRRLTPFFLLARRLMPFAFCLLTIDY
jgi:hypothetical protein